MLRTNILLLIILSFNSILAQELITYDDNIEEAEDYFESKDYSKANEYYKRAFKIVNENVISSDERFDASISFMLSNDIKSTYEQLFKIYKIEVFDEYTNYENIINEEAFEKLHSDKRWKKLTRKLKKKQEKSDNEKDEDLIQFLTELENKDQNVREDLTKVNQEFGTNSEEYKSYVKEMNEVDSLIFIEFEKFINQYGWLGPETIGEDGVNTLFLIVQHNNLDIQKKYLPFIRKAVKNGKESPSDLIFLEDRIAMYSNQLQTYGTQIKYDENGKYYVWPIKNPKSVNKRRIKNGLNTLENYLTRVGIIWDVENHKENTRKIFNTMNK